MPNHNCRLAPSLQCNPVYWGGHTLDSMSCFSLCSPSELRSYSWRTAQLLRADHRQATNPPVESLQRITCQLTTFLPGWHKSQLCINPHRPNLKIFPNWSLLFFFQGDYSCNIAYRINNIYGFTSQTKSYLGIATYLMWHLEKYDNKDVLYSSNVCNNLSTLFIGTSTCWFVLHIFSMYIYIYHSIL